MLALSAGGDIAWPVGAQAGQPHNADCRPEHQQVEWIAIMYHQQQARQQALGMHQAQHVLHSTATYAALCTP